MNKERSGQETSTGKSAPLRVAPVERLGTYSLGEPVAGDPDAEMYRAHDAARNPTEREVVVEFFPALTDGESQRRFDLFRAQLVGLEIPGVSTVLEAGMVGDRPYVIRRWIQGDTLADRRAGRGVMSPEDAVRMILPIADALVFAHTRGLIHGGITAQQLRMDPGEMVFLEGFGSCALRRGGERGPLGWAMPTIPGDIAGLAKVLRGLVRGARRPGMRRGPAADLAAATATRRAVGNTSDLDAILRRAGVVEGEASVPARGEDFSGVGYGSMAEFAADLRAWLLNRPLQARPPTVAELVRQWAWSHPLVILMGVVVLLALLAVPVAAFWWYQRTGGWGNVSAANRTRPDLDYAGTVQRAHAAIESEAWERLDALSSTPGPAGVVGPELGLLRAWLEVQSRDRLGALGAPILGLVPRGEGSRVVAWTGTGLSMLGTGLGSSSVSIRVPGGNLPLAVDHVPDERVVMVGTSAGVFSVPVPEPGSVVPPTQLHPGPSRELKVSPGGQWAASFSGETGLTGRAGESKGWKLDLVPLTAGGTVREVRLPLAPVIAWAWIEPEPGSPRLAVALGGGTGGIWDVMKTNYVSTVTRAGEVWTAAAWDSAGALMGRLDGAGVLEVINFGTGEGVFRREGHATVKPLVALAADGTRVASTTANGDVAVYRIPDGTPVALLPRRQEEVSALALLADGAVVTGTRSGAVWRWEPQSATRQPGVVLTNHLPFVSTRPCFSPDGEWVAFPDEWLEGTERFVVQRLRQPGDPESIPGQPAGYLDAQALLVWDRTAARWEAWGMAPLEKLGSGRLMEGEAWNWTALSDDARRLLVRGPGDRLEMFETQTGQRVGGLNEQVDFAALNADGRVVAVAVGDAIGVWSPLTGSMKRRPGFRAAAVAVSADGRWVAFGNDTGQVKFWPVAEPELSDDLLADASGVTALAFSSGAQSLFVATESAQCQAWQVRTRQELFRHRLTHPAGWLVVAPGDAGLLIGHPAPQGEETGDSWWWPNVAAKPAVPVDRSRSGRTTPLPKWFEKQRRGP